MCLVPHCGMCARKAQALPHHVANALGWGKLWFTIRHHVLRTCEWGCGCSLALVVVESLLARIVAVAVRDQEIRMAASVLQVIAS